MMPGRRRVCAIDCERMQSIASALSERGSSGESSYRGRQGTPVARAGTCRHRESSERIRPCWPQSGRGSGHGAASQVWPLAARSTTLANTSTVNVRCLSEHGLDSHAGGTVPEKECRFSCADWSDGIEASIECRKFRTAIQSSQDIGAMNALFAKADGKGLIRRLPALPKGRVPERQLRNPTALQWSMACEDLWSRAGPWRCTFAARRRRR